MERLIELGGKMNLEGEKLHEFVREPQAIESLGKQPSTCS